MPTQTSTLIKSVTGSYSRWPMGETRLIMTPAAAYGDNPRLTITQEGKQFKFVGRLYGEVLLRSDAFFAEYFAYLDSINVSPVGNQTLTPYYGSFVGRRTSWNSVYGAPFMRVK